jgi:geranylgeranyl diphosphate synthase type I
MGASEISKVKNHAFDELDRVTQERGQRILEKYGQVIISDVNNKELLEILNDVKRYWKDDFRPILTSLSCEAVGGDPEIADDASLMFTLASSGFGIHDDILDNSKYKHLRWTILGPHGIDGALLVGDLLIVKAWTTLHEMIRKTNKPKKIADIIEAYGKLSIEICEAEFMESRCRRKLETDVKYYENILWRAMAESEACARIGAIIGDGKPNEVEALAEFGRRLGFMSRLADDIEDCLNQKGDLPHRIKFESVPLPLLYAAKISREKFITISKIIEKSNITPWDAKTLLKFCFETEAFEYARKIAQKNKRNAASKLHELKSTKARNLLAAMNKRSYNRIVKLCI